MAERPGIYPDEYIDYWGDVYVALELKERGVDFERFLEAPAAQLKRLGVEPLLPAQERLSAAIFGKENR